MKNPLRILYVSPEVSPFVMTTDLADFAGSLPKYLKNLGHDIRVMMPNYKYVNERKYVLRDVIRLHGLNIKMGDEVLAANGKSAFIPGSKVQVYFLDNKMLFERDGLYLDRSTGQLYEDNTKRFVFFAIACLETLKLLHWQPDIIHCNDWQTGLIPMLLKSLYNKDPFFKNSKTLFSLYDGESQSMFDASVIQLAGAEESFLQTSRCAANGQISGMCAGVEYSDLTAINIECVDGELLAEQGFSQLQELFKDEASKIAGVGLGIDDQVWNPETDKLLAAQYSRDDLSGKLENKRSFMEALGLEFNEATPLACMFVNIEREETASLETKIATMTQSGMQVAVLAFGDSVDTSRFATIEKGGEGKVAVKSARDQKLQHLAKAGSDFGVSACEASRFALSILHSLAYGTVPIVKSSPAFAGPVEQFDLEKRAGNGFVFKGTKPAEYADAIRNAIACFRNKAAWNAIVRNAMESDASWSAVAPKYVKLYQKLASGKSSKN